MSLADDFRMYYGESYIAFTGADGVTRPAYVTGVDLPNRFNPSNTTEQYGIEAVQRLRFHIMVIHNGDFDESQERTETLEGGRIDLELPELGYIMDGRTPRYLMYRPVHMSKKGLVGRRLRGVSNMGNRVAIAIFDAIRKEPNNVARQFYFHENGELHYKGRVVGKHEENNVTLRTEVKYLAPIMESCFSGKTVVVGK